MESFSVDEVAGYRNAIITYVLNGASTKLPIKEREMIAAINVKGRLFTMAMGHAKSALQETYGIILDDVPDSKSGKAYVCYNIDNAKSSLMYDVEQQRQLTLLFIILSYLFMRGSDVPHKTKTDEADLTNFLKGLRIYFDINHEFFGNVKKLITETFVKQLYLKKEKVVSELDSETKFNYSWGYRATVEFDKKMLLNATAKILKKPASFFVGKFQEVYADEEGDEQMA